METLTGFQLHPQLARDTFPVAEWPVSRLLLMNDRRYPWLILVPAMAGLRDLDDLPATLVTPFWQEMHQASQLLRQMFQPEKINVAALGNVVPQLHLHVIARFRHDDAWPAPVWGKHPSLPYAPEEVDARLLALRQGLALV